jgi:hypothetical protein
MIPFVVPPPVHPRAHRLLVCCIVLVSIAVLMTFLIATAVALDRLVEKAAEIVQQATELPQ